jgi:hypothetical protein
MLSVLSCVKDVEISESKKNGQPTVDYSAGWPQGFGELPAPLELVPMLAYPIISSNPAVAMIIPPPP